MTKTIISLVLALFAGLANAGGFTVFDNVEACKIAVTAGKAVIYTPTTKAPFQGGKGWEKKTVNAGGACLGKAYVMEDGAPVNGKAVYVPEGFVYWEHTSGVFRMNDCSNPFGQLATVQPSSAGSTTAEVVSPDVPVMHGACTTNDCNTVTEVQVVNQIILRNGICQDNVLGKTFAPTNGQCNFAPVQANVSMVATSTVACGGCGNSQPTASVKPAAQTAADCVDCHPTLLLTGRKPRTDGRCVLKVKDGQDGTESYIRFGLQDKGRLTAVKVTDEAGNTNPLSGQYATMVGDGQATVQLEGNMDCNVAVRAFSTERALKWTAPRLGLRNCVPIGIVTSVRG